MTKTINTHGRMIWHVLSTRDVNGAIAFYSELLGWKAHDAGTGPMGRYTLLKLGDQNVGGLIQADPKDRSPSFWLAYCTVPSVDEAVARAATLGGTVVHRPTDIP